MSNDERDTVEVLAHRIAWRYKMSSDPHHSDTYTFNRATLLQFAAELGQARAAIAQPAEPQADAGAWGLNIPRGAAQADAQPVAWRFARSYWDRLESKNAQQAAEIARQQQVIAEVNSRCDHLGMRLGEVIKERDALRVDAERRKSGIDAKVNRRQCLRLLEEYRAACFQEGWDAAREST